MSTETVDCCRSIPSEMTDNTAVGIEMLETGLGPAVQPKNGVQPSKRQEVKFILHHAASINDLSILKKNNLKELNKPDEYGYAPLHYAARYSNFEILEELLKAGADPELCSDNKEKFTFLHFLAYYPDKKSTSEVTIHPGREFIGLLRTKGAIYITAKDGERCTPLHLACRKGNLTLVKILVKYCGDEVNKIQDEYNNQGRDSPLHEACRGGNAEIVMELKEHFKGFVSKLQAQNKHGMTPVHVACMNGHFEIVKYILDVINEEDRKAIANLQNENCQWRTPLYFACKSGDERIVEKLLDCDADVTSSEVHYYYPIHIAAQQGYVVIAKHLQDHHQEPLHEVKDRFYNTPLHYAARYNRVEMIKFLLTTNDKQRSVMLKSKTRELHTPLIVAAIEGHVEACETLLKRNAPYDDADINGKTILHIAVENNHVKLFEKILDIIAETKNMESFLNSADRNSDTALHIAAMKGNTQCAEYLLKCEGILMEARNGDYSSPLHLAAKYGHTAIMKMLLDRLCSFLDGDKDDNSAYHLVCEFGHYDAAKLLLQYQIGLSIMNKMGWTPLDTAAFNGHDKIVELLINTKSNESYTTPLHLAIKQGHPEVVRVLLKTSTDISECQSGLTAIEAAIKYKHESVAMVIIESSQWDKALCKSATNGTTPFNDLIEEMPLVAECILNKCTVVENLKENKEIETSIDFTNAEESGQSQLSHDREQDVNKKRDERQDEQIASETHKKVEVFNNIFSPQKEHPLLIMAEKHRKSLLVHSLTTEVVSSKLTVGLLFYIFGLLMYAMFVVLLTTFAILSPNPQSSTCEAVFSGQFGQMNSQTNISLQECGSDVGPISNMSSDISIPEFDDDIRKYLCSNSSTRDLCGLTDEECGICPHEGITGLAIIIFIMGVLQVFFEALQIINLQKKYFKDWTNTIDILLLICSILFSSSFAFKCGCHMNWQWQVGSIAIFLAWVDFLIFIRMLPLVGTYILMFDKIFRTFVGTILLTLVLVIAFALAFYMIFKEPRPEFERSSFATIGRSCAKVTTMTTGELDFDTLFRQFPGGNSEQVMEIPFVGVSFTLWILFLILMPVLLSNLLTGLAIDDVQKIKEEAEFKKLELWIEFALNMETFYCKIKVTVRWLRQKLCHTSSTSKDGNTPSSKKPSLPLWFTSWLLSITNKDELQAQDEQLKQLKDTVDELTKKIISMESTLQRSLK